MLVVSMLHHFQTGAGVAQKYAVMFYIHGGDFYKGASNTFPAHILAAFYDVVVVTINYRLGALGIVQTFITGFVLKFRHICFRKIIEK